MKPVMLLASRSLTFWPTVQPGVPGGPPAPSTATAMVPYRPRLTLALRAASRAMRRPAATLPPQSVPTAPTSSGAPSTGSSGVNGAVTGAVTP